MEGVIAMVMKTDLPDENMIRFPHDIGIITLRFISDPVFMPFLPFLSRKSQASALRIIAAEIQIIPAVVCHGERISQEFCPVIQFLQRRNIQTEFSCFWLFYGHC